jgi:hypothetical protein
LDENNNLTVDLSSHSFAKDVYHGSTLIKTLQLSGANVGKYAFDINPSANINCSLTVNCKSSAYTQYCAGRVCWNGSSAVKDFVASSSQSDFTINGSSVGTYTITYTSGAHPSGGVSYVVNVTGYSCIAILRSTAPPTATTFTVALYSNTSTWGQQ